MFYKIAPLMLKSAENKSGTTCDIFISQPDSDKEDLAGKLFFLAEIESKTADDIKVINFLVDSLEHNYYQNEKLIMRERVKTIKIEHIFESAIAKTNKALFDFIKTEKIRFDQKKINSLVGVVYENRLHFANIGKNKAFLIYKDKISSNSSKNKQRDFIPVSEIRYKSTDILAQTNANEEEKREINPTKLFSSVISGTIPAEGYFFFTNEALSEYLSNKQLIDITTTLPPMSAVEQIKNTLTQINSYVSFLGIIIKNTTGQTEPESRRPVAPASTLESISNFNSVESATERILAPGGYINFKKWFGDWKILNFIPGFLKISNIKFSTSGVLKDKIFFKKRSTFFSLEKIISFFKNITAFTAGFFFFIIKLLTDKEKIIALARNAYSGFISFFINIKQTSINFGLWIKNLSLRNKILLAVTLVSLIIFMQNVIIMNHRNKKLKETANITELTKLLEQKQNQIEANLLYNNEEEIKKLLDETKILLDKFPAGYETANNPSYVAFLNKYNEQIEKIRKVVNLDNLVEIGNFSKLNFNANPQNIILAGGKIFASDARVKTIYIVDTASNLITSASSTDDTIALKFPVLDKNDNIYYFNNAGYIAFNTKTNKADKLSITISNPDDIMTSAFYNNRLYLLNHKESQIYTFAKANGGFAKQTPWLTETADLTNAASMAIDGNIYVLKTDGTVLKFSKGKSEDFTLNTPDPKIDTAGKLSVKDDLKYIYILEPAKQRLIIFTKEGKFIEQYKSDKFTDLRDFAVDEKAKTLYFLNGATVLKGAGDHFDKK